MERVFSVEEIPNPLWSPSPATSSAAGGPDRNTLSRSPSEWLLEKFLEGGDPSVPQPPPLPNPSPNFPAASVVSSNFSSGRKDADEVVAEVKNLRRPPPPTTAQAPPAADPEVDPAEYAAILKQKLDMYCHAVALARGSGLNPQDPSLADTRSPASDSSQLGSQVAVSGKIAYEQL